MTAGWVKTSDKKQRTDNNTRPGVNNAPTGKNQGTVMRMKRPQQQNKRAAASSARVALGAMALAGVAACAFAAAGAGQQQRQRAVNSGGSVGNGRVSIALYAGETGDVMPAGWGSGKAEVSGENVLVGTRSLKVTTQGLYQGARLDFRNPVDLTQAFAAPNAYLRLQLRFPNVSAGGGGAMGGPGADPADRTAAAVPAGWAPRAGVRAGAEPTAAGVVAADVAARVASAAPARRWRRGRPLWRRRRSGRAVVGVGGGRWWRPVRRWWSRRNRRHGWWPLRWRRPSGMGGFGGEGVTSPFQRMRFLLVMADGTRHELVRPVSIPPASDDETAYVPLSFPLRALLKGSSKGGNNGQSTERTASPPAKGRAWPSWPFLATGISSFLSARSRF
jgi:hypothetical protein